MTLRRLLAIVLCVAGSLVFAQEASESLANEARTASRAGRFREAALKFHEAAIATTDPVRRGKLELSAAYAHFNEKNGKAAREALERAFTADPEVEIVAEFFDPAFVKLVGEIRQVVKPTPPPAPVDLAELKRSAAERLKDGRADEVVYDLKNVPPAQLDREAWELMARAYDQLGRAAEAANARRIAAGGAIPASPEPTPAPRATGARSDAELLLFQARDALARGNSFQAQNLARQVLASDPVSTEAYRLLGDAFLAQNEMAMAEANWKQALRYDERNEAALLSLFDYYVTAGNTDGALDALSKAAKVNERNVPTLVALARKLRAQGDFAHARQAYAGAEEVQPSDAALLSEHAQMLIEKGEPDTALPLLTKTASLRGRDPIVHNNLAAVYRWKSQNADAEREYREALRYAPEHMPALVGLGTLLLTNGSPAEAATVLQKAADLEPGRPEVIVGLLRAQRLKGDLDAAQAAATKAIGGAAGPVNAEDAIVWNEAAFIAYQQGRFDEAARLFEAAAQKDPALAAARTNREKALGAGRFLAALESQAPLQGVAKPAP